MRHIFKDIKNKMKYINIILLLFILLNSFTLRAQNKESKWEIKGKESTFIGYGSRIGKSQGKLILYHNKKYDIDKITENREPVSLSTFILYRIDNHDKYLNVFKNVFTEKRIKELAANNEIMDVAFLLDEKGQIMTIDYTLLANSNITANELEELEKELLDNISFKVINEIEPNSYGFFSIKTRFEQVMKGEIKAIRENEKMTEEYL